MSNATCSFLSIIIYITHILIVYITHIFIEYFAHILLLNPPATLLHQKEYLLPSLLERGWG